MSKNTIEVELRGPLEEENYLKLIDKLKSVANSITIENRFLIDYSTFIEGIGDRKLDVRVRSTNGKVELVVKKGKFGGTHREEASVFVEGGDIERAIKVMALLGYKKGVACDRGIKRYKVGNIEIAIQEARIYGSKEKNLHSRFFEAEIECSDEAKDNAIHEIRTFLEKLQLVTFTEDQWNSYVLTLNNQANGIFDFDYDDIESIRHMGQAEECNSRPL